jgi:hypothetical protein
MDDSSSFYAFIVKIFQYNPHVINNRTGINPPVADKPAFTAKHTFIQFLCQPFKLSATKEQVHLPEVEIGMIPRRAGCGASSAH